MRILVLEPAARDQHAGLDQRLDDGVVGIALFALVREHALADEARRMIGECAILVDGVGDHGVDAARFESGLIRRPHLEVLAPVAGRGVHETGAGVVSDVVAGEQGDVKVVVARKALERMLANEDRQVVHSDRFQSLKLGHARMLENIRGELVGEHELLARLGPVAGRRVDDFVESVLDSSARS